MFAYGWCGCMNTTRSVRRWQECRKEACGGWTGWTGGAWKFPDNSHSLLIMIILWVISRSFIYFPATGGKCQHKKSQITGNKKIVTTSKQLWLCVGVHQRAISTMMKMTKGKEWLRKDKVLLGTEVISWPCPSGLLGFVFYFFCSVIRAGTMSIHVVKDLSNRIFLLLKIC